MAVDDEYFADIMSEEAALLPMPSDSSDFDDDDENDQDDDSVENEIDFNHLQLEKDEKDLALEMHQLSMKEREEVLFDIHGVRSTQESAEIVNDSMADLDTWIEKMKYGKQAKAYRKAEVHSPEYVKDKEFRLQFLRTDDYDAQNAGFRIFRHFEEKLRLFGETKLRKDITLDDLSEEDMEVMRNGQQQYLPVRDQSGRAIFVVSLPFFKDHFSIESVARVVFYLTMVGCIDEETQKKGVVLVIYNSTSLESKKPNPRMVRAIKRTRDATPLVNISMHFCMDDSIIKRGFAAFANRLLNRKDRLRFRVHVGNYKRCMDSLMSFGIPISNFPVTETGQLNREKHHELIQMMRAIEDKKSSGPFVLIPSSRDILFGRGKGLHKHVGNLRLRLVMESYFAEYERVGKVEKTKLASKIVEEVKKNGSRFLKKSSGAWEVAPDEEARKKVSHYFRNVRGAVERTKNPINRKRDHQG